MNFETMRDVLQRAEQFHQQLSDRFQQLGAAEQEGKVQMLLQYLSRHEANLAKAMHEYGIDGQKEVLNTWIQYTTPSLRVDSALTGHMAFDQLVDKALAFDDALLELYGTIVQEADIPEVREVAENLLAMENEERRRRVRSIAELQDM